MLAILAMQVMIESMAERGLKGLQVFHGNSYAKLCACVASPLHHLDLADRQCLACLSIFPHDFSLSAAAAVLGQDQSDTKFCLQRIANSQCVSADLRKARFSMHLLIRDIAAEGFMQDAKYLAAERRFVVLHLDELSRASYLHTPEGLQQLKSLARSRVNFQKAFCYLARFIKQKKPLEPEKMRSYCSLSLSALLFVEALKLETIETKQVVSEAMQQLLEWTEAAEDHESANFARAQLGAVLLMVPGPARAAKHELTKAYGAIISMKGPQCKDLIQPLHALSNAVDALWHMGDLSEGEADVEAGAYVEAEYALLSEHMDINHPQSVMCLADVAYYKPDTQQKIIDLTQQVQHAEKVLGPLHPAMLPVQLQLCRSMCNADAEQLTRAIQKLRDLLDHCQQHFGSKHLYTAQVQLELGNALTLSQQEEGLCVMRQGLLGLVTQLGQTHELLLLYHVDWLVPALLAMGKAEDAIKELEQTSALYDQTFGPDSCIAVQCLRHLAEANCMLHNLSVAHSQLVQAETKVKRHRHSLPENLQNAAVAKEGIMLDLARLLEKQSR